MKLARTAKAALAFAGFLSLGGCGTLLPTMPVTTTAPAATAPAPAAAPVTGITSSIIGGVCTIIGNLAVDVLSGM